MRSADAKALLPLPPGLPRFDPTRGAGGSGFFGFRGHGSDSSSSSREATGEPLAGARSRGGGEATAEAAGGAAAVAGAGGGSPGLAAPGGGRRARPRRRARRWRAAASPPPPPAGPSSGGAVAGTAGSRGPVPPWLPAVPATALQPSARLLFSAAGVVTGGSETSPADDSAACKGRWRGSQRRGTASVREKAITRTMSMTP